MRGRISYNLIFLPFAGVLCPCLGTDDHHLVAAFILLITGGPALDVAAVGLHVPCRASVGVVSIEDGTQFLLQAGILDGTEDLNPRSRFRFMRSAEPMKYSSSSLFLK